MVEKVVFWSGEQLGDVGFRQCGHAKQRGDFGYRVGTFFHGGLNPCHDEIGADRHPQVRLNSVFRMPPEGLDCKVLLDPLEKRLYLPSVAVEVGNIQRSGLGEVGDEHELISAFGVGVLNHPERLGIQFG